MTLKDLTMTVDDDGCGLDSKNVLRPTGERIFSGNGLGNMRKRMSEIGGALEIASEPGKGTVLVIKVTL